MAGILRYGSYIPFCRLQRSDLGSRGRGERSVASFDEDSTSLAIEAGREALRGSGLAPTHVLLASTSHAYAEKLNAAAVHAALNLPPQACSVDLASSTRAGLSGLALAASLTGGPSLLCAADVVVGAPSGPRESIGGDGACAFVLGNGPGVVAEILGKASLTNELLDVWRGPEQPFARQWEERFAQQRLVPLLVLAFREALAQTAVLPSELSCVAVDSWHPRVGTAFARATGLRRDQVADDLAATVGRTGAAHAGLLLASLLDSASPGDRVAVLSAADGAEALVLEVCEGIAAARPSRGVAAWIDSKQVGLPYRTYLKWREILPFEPPRRPAPPRPASPPMQRSERWKYAFVGSQCRSCDTVNLPPQRICVQCGALDEMDSVGFADATARVATYTIDHLAYSPQPPVVAAVIDFDQGGRFACELADVDPANVAVGQELEMTFRRLYTSEGIRNYFWKARPRR